MCPVLFSLEPVPPARLVVAPPTPAARPYQAGGQVKSGPCPKAGTCQRPTGQERREQLRSCGQTQDLPSSSSIPAEEFKHLLQSLMPSLSPDQYNTLMAKVMRREGQVSMNCQDFTRGRPSDCPLQSQKGAAWSRCSSVAEQPSRSLQELQQGLKHQIGSNLKGAMRALRLYDYNRDGLIQRHELRRFLDNYLPMTDTEFKRLWSFYNPNNFAMMPYKEFLMKLGINCEMYAKFVPQPGSLVVNAQASEEAWRRHEKETPCPVSSGQALTVADLTPEQTQEVFLNKMRQSYTEVWRVLQAFDVTCSGVLPLEDLHSVINNFLFPMSPCAFHRLLRRLGVRFSRTVYWKNFMTKVKGAAHTEAKTKYDNRRLCLIVRDTTDQRASAPSRREDSSDQVEQKDKDKAVRSAWTEKATLAADTWTTVEELLRDKLSESLTAVSLTLGQLDRCGKGTVRQEELRKIIQQHGLPLSDQHFNRLCEPYTVSGRVQYKHFLQHLWMLASTRGTDSGLKTQCATDRLASGPHVKEADDLLWRLKERLSLLALTLADCLPPGGSVSASQLRTILQDCNLSVDEKQLQSLTRVLGFRAGRTSCSGLLKKYSGILARYQKRAPVPVKPDAGAPARLLTAEDCLSLMLDRITEVHGSVFSAFRFMDKDSDGFVLARDYLDLHTSLGFITKESEHGRLLRLLGLGPGKNLSYREFQSIVRSKGRKLALQPASGLEQLHQTLVTNAIYRWPDMSRKLSQYGEDGVQIVLKNDFKNLACSFGLPVTPAELQALWLRYDPTGKGYLTLSEFREKLQEDHTADIYGPVNAVSLNSSSPKPSQTEVSLKDIGDLVRRHYHELTSALSRLEVRRRDGRVRLEDLQSVLQQHGRRLEREQLTQLLQSLKVRVVAGALSWLSFLRAFELGPVQRSEVRSPTPAPTENLETLSPERAIQRISELVTASAHTLHKVFSSFDRDGNGMLSSLDFRRVLEHFCARVSDRQYRYLLNRLVLDWENNAVCWRNFLHQFNLNNKQAPERKLIMETRACTPVQLQSLPDTEILDCVRQVVSEHLFSIVMEMVDMDPTNCGSISKDEFRDIADHHLHFLSPEQLEWLWEQLPLTERGVLDYRTFLKCFSSGDFCLSLTSPSLTPDMTISPVNVQTSPIPPRPRTPPCGSRSSKGQAQRRRPSSSPLLNCEASERRIQSRVRCCWKEIQRRCRLEDQQRSGQISQHTFMEILKELHINLTDREFRQLAVKYDIQNTGQLSYPDFLRHFVLFLRPQTKQALGKPKPNEQTLAFVSDQCAEAHLRMSESVQQCWKSMRQSFAVHDHHHSGTISIPDFRKVLRQHSVNLSEDEFLHLASCFDKDAGGRISYNDFLRTFLG
ncbi:EF-hand calcium-binding domain-containing protein 6-like isoform X3 [Alosa sapidissima]|uniref:EF-hand calcium-binding domain-containing protein 6-like isoform X3 n=1 Tax=Alosa sapidissima TaxID=34773 RepID=UPI001C085CB5|nr:EF-hand calcium-binding domain-containing protein 6-like isoform X3 [Alosa sapidissima]